MKKTFLSYLKNQVSQNEKLLSSNALSEEDKSMIQSTIENLNATIEEVDKMEGDDNEAINSLKETIAALEEGLKAVQEKIAQKPEEITQDTTTMEKDYLKSENSIHDFANAIRESKSNKDFGKNWGSYLAKNGITIASGSESAYLPDAVKGMIQDIWDRNADWLKDLNIIGAKRYQIRKNDNEQDNSNSRAKGFKKGDTKTAQSLQFSAKEVTAQFIYKLQEISLEDEWNDDGSLINYIVTELVDQILYEEKRAILIGDGRASNATGKINKIEAIAKSTTDSYTVVSTVTANGFLVDDMRAMVDGLHNPNNKPVYVFMNKSSLRTLSRVQASQSSTPVYMGIDQVCEQIGATKIITTDLLGGASGYTALAMIPSEYVMIGENVLNPTLYKWHEGYENVDVYRYECIVGGAIEGLNSTACLKTE